MFYPVDALCREHLYPRQERAILTLRIYFMSFIRFAPPITSYYEQIFSCLVVPSIMMLVVMNIIATLHNFIHIDIDIDIVTVLT